MIRRSNKSAVFNKDSVNFYLWMLKSINSVLFFGKLKIVAFP